MNPDEIKVKGENPRIILHNFSSSDDMLVGGKIEYIPDGDCLMAQVDRGGKVVSLTPVWPQGFESVQENNKRGVADTDSGTFLEGDNVQASGTFLDADDEAMAEVGIDSPCRSSRGFVVFNKGSFTNG
ncbi:hypothetical protein [Streptomyces sp. cmx-18-6]|uniref:hypothetical protein n=1 Tax=Streptomyces sp. cmx-18-6 TaxID=2790930 RepID=UPI0039807302